MNFTIKEIYIALLPGFVLLVHAFIIYSLYHSVDMNFFTKEITALLLLTLLVIGYANNMFASLIDHKYKKREPDTKKLPEGKNWHDIKDSIEYNEKIEGYFTRFAQARNMCSAMFLSSIMALIIVCNNCQCLYILLLAFDLIVFHILIKDTLPHQRKRYYQVIYAEYAKLQKNQM